MIKNLNPKISMRLKNHVGHSNQFVDQEETVNVYSNFSIKEILLRFSLVFLIFLTGCKYFETQVLDDNHQIAMEEGEQKGIPAIAFNNGYFDHFGGDISVWWSASPDLILSKKGDTLRVDSKNVGSKYVPFGRTFPALDFSETPVLRIRMRYEGNLAPDVRVDMADIYEKQADGVNKQRLRKGDYRDYYFNFNNKWKQAWPKPEPVDSKAIGKIVIFINPGTADWTGTLFIDEIAIVKESDIPSKKPVTPVKDSVNTNTNNNTVVTESVEAKLIDDFSGQDINNWWSGAEGKVTLSKEEEMLKVDFKEAGPAYETFGRGFDKINFLKTPVLKVRVKVQGEKPANLRIDVKDASGFSTNARPTAIKIESGTDFVNYYYDFTNKFEQSWPNVQKVDPEGVVEVVFFVNPGGQAYTGTIYIDEIKAISLEDFKSKK
ncbi:MAG: hypothetical protein K2X86_15355 [Cytophagaceae bacterium]|nr:hypothetical protein [Cytophagaceae bacterium]